MNIQINNQAKLSNKHVRLVKWKLYKIARKFNHLIYAEVYLKREGLTYQTTVKLGVKGNDIVLNHKNKNIYKLCKTTFDDGLRYLRKYKDKYLIQKEYGRA